MKQVDFIIVGQGIAGTLLAHDLDDRHQSLAIIDTPLPATSSRVAAGLINPVGMKRCIPSENAATYLPFAFERYCVLQQKLGQSFFYPMPIVRLFANEQQRHQWQIKFSNSNMDRYIKEITKEAEYAPLNDNFGSAIISPSARLDVNKWLRVSRDYFTNKHLVLEERFDFSQCNVENANYKGISAKHILFCEGHHIKSNPFFSHLPLSPTKGEVMTIYIPSLEQFEGMVSKGVYLIPKGFHEYLVGATYDHSDFTERLTKEAERFLVRQLRRMLTVDFEIIDRSAGVRPTVKHRKPLVGLHALHPKIGVFNGLGTRGLLQGPYLSANFSSQLTRIEKNNKELIIND